MNTILALRRIAKEHQPERVTLNVVADQLERADSELNEIRKIVLQRLPEHAALDELSIHIGTMQRMLTGLSYKDRAE